MEFKKTVAGISAAAIAVTQVAAVIPMGAFAATTAVDSANVQFALNYKAGSTTNSVKAAASAKTATVNAADITSVEDFGLSFSGAITGADLADGDKYTFTANGLTVTAKEKDTKSADQTGTVWVEADGVDLDGTTAAGKLDVEDAGAVGDTVTITYTKGETDIKVVDSTGADINNETSETGKFTFALTADSASKFTVSGDGVTVNSVKVTTKTESELTIGTADLTTDGSEQTVAATGGAFGDKVTVTYAETANFPEDGGEKSLTIADTAVTSSPYTFTLTEDMVTNGFKVSGNGYTISKIQLTHTEEADLNKSGEIKDTKTPATVTVAADKFTDVDLVDGSTLTVGTAKTGENDGTITIKAGDVVITEGTAPAESYILNAEQAAAVKANGLTITGSGIKLCQVDYRVKGETTKGQTITLFSGSGSVVWSETYAAETQTWETLAEDTSKTTVSTADLTLDTLEAFKGKYENITAAWSELTAVKVTPDAPTVVEKELPYADETGVDLSKNYIKFGAVENAAKDGTITVGVKDTEGAAVVLKDADGVQLDTKTIADDAASVVFTLTEEQAAKVAANGFIVAGTKGTVTSVAYAAKQVNPEPTEKNTVTKDIGFTDADGIDLAKNKIQINASEMAADGKITVTLKANVTNEIALKSVAEGNEVIVKAAPAENATEVVFTLTADQAAKAAEGFIVEADAGVVTGVAYKAKKEEKPDPVDKSQTIKQIDNNNVPVSEVSNATKVKITVNVTTLTEGKGVLSFYTNTAVPPEDGEWKQVDYGTAAADTENHITETGEMTATVDFPVEAGDQWYQIGVKTSDPDVINGKLVKIEFVNADDETVYTYDPNAASIGTDNFTFSTIKNEEMKVGDSFTVTYDSNNTPKNAKYVIKYKIHAPNDPGAWEGYIYPEVVNNGKIDNSSSAKTGLKVTSATEGTVTTFTFTAVSKTTVEPFGVNIEISSSGKWDDTQYPWFGDVSFFVKSAADEDTTKIDINAANFPDANFRKVLTAYSSEKVKNVPVLTEADIAKITDLGNEKADTKFKDEAANLAKVVNFKGIEKLTALKSFTLTNTQRNFKALDLSENAALTFVDVSGCTNLADLKLPETAAIETLLLQKTAITAVDVSKYTGLKVLNVSDTKLTALDVKANTELETLALANVKVKELDVKANTALKTLDAANCGLTKIDVSANTLLEDLDVSGNSLITLDLTGLTALTADKFKADNNKRNIGTVIDNTYDLKDLVADGLVVDKMGDITGATLTEGVLTDVKGDVTYTYETGLETEGLDKVTFTLAPEKVTSDNFEVSYMNGEEMKSVVCEKWDEVLKTMTDKNVDYTVEVKKDVEVDNLKMPTAAKAKSVTVACTGNTITTKSASVTLPTNTKLENVKIKALDSKDKEGKTLAKTFTLNASKDLTVAGGLEIEAKASTIKGGARSVLETVQSINEFDSAITGFGTVRVDNGAVTFNNTVKVKELDVKNGSVVEIGKNAAVTVTNITSDGSTPSKLVYTDAEYKPVAVTGNITGNVKLEVGIKYKKTASAEDGQEPTTTTVSKFAKDDVVLVSKNANLSAVDASESLPEGATLGRDKSNIKVMDTVATMNGVEYAQWSDITSTIAAAAKADKNAAKTAVYNITLSKELDAKGALKMPAANTFGTLIIKSDAAAQTIKFTGNLTLTGKTIFENVKLDSVKTVKGVSTSYDFSISAGKNDLTLSNVTSGKSIKSISSNGTLLLDNVAVTAVNGATVEISNSSTAQHSMGALVDGKWKGEAAPDTSVVVEGNLTAKTALRFVGNEAGLRVKGVVNAAKITAAENDSVLVVDKLAKNKNALIIGKGGFDGSSKAVKFVLMDTENNETAQITENLTLGTIAGPYADQFIPSDSNLAESDSYYIIKSGKNLVAVPKQTKGEDDQKKDYLVEVTVNNKKAYYKNLDEAIKDINEIGTKTTDCVIKLTPEMFEGKTLAKLPLPNAGKYDHLYYSAESDVTINVTSDLALTGNLTLSTKITLNKVDKKDGSVQPINISLGKYGLTIFNVISADHSNGEESAPSSMIGNITGTGRINMNGNIVINGKVAKTVTFYAQDASIILEGAMSAFEGTITAPNSSSTAIFTYDKSNAKNVKFQEISGFKKFTLAYRGEDEIAEGDIIASIAGDYSDKNTVTAGSTELVVVRSGNNLKAVNKNDVLTVQEYSGTLFDTDDDEEPILIATRSYDTFANAVKDIERIKNPIGLYAVYAHKGDVLVLPKAKTYDTLMVASTEDATESYAITTAKDLTLTGNLVLMNINLDKVVRGAVQPMSINLGNYSFMAQNSHVSYDANKKVSQFTNINGVKGTFGLMDNMTVSGKVNVGTFAVNSVVTFGDKAGFAAATEISVGEGSNGNYPTFIYPLATAKNIDLSNIDTEKTFAIKVEGAKDGDQVAAVKGDMIRHDIILNDGEFIIVRSGNKLIAAKEDNEYTLYAPDQSIRLFDTYDNAVAYITKLNNANGIYELKLPQSADNIELKKLTLPTKGKYSGLSITASNTDGTTIIVNSDIALTGDLALKGDLTLMKDGEKLLKITSPLDSKTKQPLYQFTLVDYANVVNGTFNGTPIETPEVEKTVIEATLPYSSDGGVDLAENILKFGATKVVKKGTILVTFKDTATFALYDADGNLLANASNTGNGYANFDLTDDQAAKITAGGFTVSGKKGIVTGVKYSAPPVTVTEPQIIGFTDASLDLSEYVIDISEANVAENGVITVIFKEHVANEITLRYHNYTVLAKKTLADGATSLTFTLTAYQASEITANGFYINGDAGVVTSVTYTEPTAPTTPEAKGAYGGSLNYNGDGIDLSSFVLQINKKAVVENGTITVTLKEEVTSSVIFKKTNRTDVIKTVAPTSGSTTYTWELSADDAAYIAENGFVIDGTEGVLTSVTYTAPDSSDIDDNGSEDV